LAEWRKARLADIGKEDAGVAKQQQQAHKQVQSSLISMEPPADSSRHLLMGH
jgi:hypothetical protein